MLLARISPRKCIVSIFLATLMTIFYILTTQTNLGQYLYSYSSVTPAAKSGTGHVSKPSVANMPCAEKTAPSRERKRRPKILNTSTTTLNTTKTRLSAIAKKAQDTVRKTKSQKVHRRPEKFLNATGGKFQPLYYNQSLGKTKSTSNASESSFENLIWKIDNASRNSQEVRHIVFVKIHKAASSTLYGIFTRFALARQLNILLPRNGHVLSQVRGTMGPLIHHPPSPPFLFHILCNHVVFNHTEIQPIFPADTKYVAMVRQPFRQVRSAFCFYRTVFSKKYLRPAHDFEVFVRNQSTFEASSPYVSFTNNRMSIDLGLEPVHVPDPGYVTTFVRRLDALFDLVLIADRFNESMILLKRNFRWTLKDIVYSKLNSQRYKPFCATELSEELMDGFKRFQRYDQAVYEHFLRIFDQKVTQEGPDFKKELEHFVTVQNMINTFCSDKKSEADLIVPRSKWGKQFTLRKAECKILKSSERSLNRMARQAHQTRFGDVSG